MTSLGLWMLTGAVLGAFFGFAMDDPILGSVLGLILGAAFGAAKINKIKKEKQAKTRDKQTKNSL